MYPLAWQASSSSEHTVVIIHSQSVHWTAIQTHLNTAHSHYYIPLSLSLSVCVLCFSLSFLTCFFFLSALWLICVFPASLLHLPIIIRSQALSSILPFFHTCATYLFTQSSELRGELPGCQAALIYLSLFAAPLAIILELRQRSQRGLCQCRKLVCNQDAWVNILTECWMNACRVTCIIHVLSFVCFALHVHTYI